MVFGRVRVEIRPGNVDVVRKYAHPFGSARVERASGPDGGIFFSRAVEIGPALPSIDFSVVASARGYRSRMGEAVVAADEAEHFETSEASASGYGTGSARDAGGRSGRVRIATYGPTEHEPFGDRRALPYEIKFFQGGSRRESGRPQSEFFVIFVPHDDAVPVFVTPVYVGIGVGVEKLEGVLSVPLRANHGGTGSVERREASAGAH